MREAELRVSSHFVWLWDVCSYHLVWEQILSSILDAAHDNPKLPGCGFVMPFRAFVHFDALAAP